MESFNIAVTCQSASLPFFVLSGNVPPHNSHFWGGALPDDAKNGCGAD